jgi:DNA polymerase III delta prime subunit
MKFVILDEVDYMTKNAQQALRYLLQSYSNNVRFCLICNYISKIDEGLQNEFIRLRFNQLPREDIISFLKHISDTEKINMSYKSLSNIQKLYRSDIRSMINFIQSNQDIVKNQSENDANLYIIDNDIWENLIYNLSKREKLENICAYVHSISIKYNIDKKNIIKDFLNYIIRNKTNIINPKFLNFVENLMHSQNLNNNHHIYYSLSQLSSFISSDTL